MSVILGSDGSIKIDLGDGQRFIANVFSYRVNLGRETLPQTRQGDEAVKRTGGLADHTGSVSLRMQFSDDNEYIESAWQILDYVLAGSDDELKAEIELYLQRQGTVVQCGDDFTTIIPESVYLAGTVVLTNVSIDCADPGEPVVAVLSWEADGALALQRGET
jgi:hypothetical protein